uniref:Uncharacterized protein n=1 Tax=Meloidogyne incognita TaxID=6306 RepID=A0A914LI98_MELIC
MTLKSAPVLNFKPIYRPPNVEKQKRAKLNFWFKNPTIQIIADSKELIALIQSRQDALVFGLHLGPELRTLPDFGVIRHSSMSLRTIFTDSWSIVIQGTTIHLLIQHLNLTEMRINRAIDSLKHALIDRLLQNGKFDLILHKAQKHANKFIFHVPKNLQIVDEIQEDVPDDEDDLWKRIEEMEQNIIFCV